MKNIAAALALAVFALPAIAFPVRASCAPAQEGGTNFTEIEGKEWLLAEVRNGGKTVLLDRAKLDADGMGGFFTVSFQEKRASGTGAPNRYFGPYTLGPNRALGIQTPASTMMAALKTPDQLNESDYFTYLSKIARWDLKEGKLELYSADSGTALIFAQR